MSGVVYLVGAGPGAPDLLTVRAQKVAVGKRCGRHSTVQKFINKRLVDAARRHQVVVRLKGGDPMLFGRAQEEIDALAAAGIRYVVVPGITAALAASAELGVSLTRRGVSRSVAFVTPRIGEGEAAGDWVQAALGAETVAVYMGAGEAGAIAAALIAAGKPAATPVAIAESVSLEDSRVVAGRLDELERLAARRGSGPAVVLIGEVWRRLVLRASQPRAKNLQNA